MQADRRIGMPGGPNYAMSPSANRGQYKPPTFNGVGPGNGNPAAGAGGGGHGGVKRERAVLQDVSNVGVNGNGGVGSEGPEAKKQRVDAPPGVENGGVAST